MVASVSALTSSEQAASYYEADDYYSEGGLSPSEWQGAGAEALGLSGEVDRDQFRDLLDGTVAGKPLGTVRDGPLEPRPGRDVTSRAPHPVPTLSQLPGAPRSIAAHRTPARPAP